MSTCRCWNATRSDAPQTHTSFKKLSGFIRFSARVLHCNSNSQSGFNLCFQDTTALLPLSVLAGSQEEKKHQCQIKAGSKCSEEKKKSELQPAAIVSVCESGAVICVCVRAKHLAPPFHNMPQYMKSLRRSCAYYQHSYP